MYLIENLSQTFRNDEISEGAYLELECFIGNSQTSVKIFNLITKNQVAKSRFCSNFTEATTTTTTTKETNIVSKRTQSLTRTGSKSK